MFEALSKTLIGEWGNGLYEFVMSNQLIISITVVIIGAVMIVVKRRKQNNGEKNERN